MSAASGAKGAALNATVSTAGAEPVVDPDSLDFKKDQVARLQAKANKQSSHLAETERALEAAEHALAEAKKG